MIWYVVVSVPYRSIELSLPPHEAVDHIRLVHFPQNLKEKSMLFKVDREQAFQ